MIAIFIIAWAVVIYDNNLLPKEIKLFAAFNICFSKGINFVGVIILFIFSICFWTSPPNIESARLTKDAGVFNPCIAIA